MKIVINKLIKSIIMLTLVLVLSTTVKAQFGPAGPGSGAPGTSVVPPDYGGSGAVPFDGGLSIILIAAGAGLAKRKKAFPPSQEVI